MATTQRKSGEGRIFGITAVMVLAVIWPLCARAQNIDGDVESVIRQLGLKKESVVEEFIVKKTLPYDKNLSVIAIPKLASHEDGFDEFDAYVVVAKDGKITRKFFAPKAWGSDAIAIASISIDTAPYILNRDTRAFGVRIERYHSGAMSQSITELSLFVPQGGTLIRVLKDYKVNSTFSEGSYYDHDLGDCAMESQDSKGFISIAKEKTNGFANLLINNKITVTKEVTVKGVCTEKTVKKSTTQTLKFNGREYK